MVIMSVRNDILIELVKEVLGPRDGPNEILAHGHDPRDEYITGVLAPNSLTQSILNIDADIDDIGKEATSEEDQDSQLKISAPEIFAPALHPKDLPRSLGISFTIESNNDVPLIEICTTWARYLPHSEGWIRTPLSFISGPIPINEANEWDTNDNVKIILRSSLQDNGDYKVSVYLQNIINQVEARPTTSEFVFQPQIRVYCPDGINLKPVGRDVDQSRNHQGDVGNDDSGLLIYRNRKAFARGHMCSAIWKEIDPERPSSSTSTYNSAPYCWVDKNIIERADQEKFTPSDIRTEFVPIYPIGSPSMVWNDHHGQSPMLDSGSLAEVWNPDEINENLQPLVVGYRDWIENQRNSINGIPEEFRRIANQNIQNCEDAANRIEAAIGLLVSNEDIRLAFCFANKAISIQSLWVRGQGMIWRPFQLAFLLLNIQSIVDPTHPDRNKCDLLWFPTGGGKTEAYLGIMAFVIAFRRLRALSDDVTDRSGSGICVISRYSLRLLTIQQFRRTLHLITACELLRVKNITARNIPTGWRPDDCSNQNDWVWGGVRFSLGLWVGSKVTPNDLISYGPFPGPSGLTLSLGALDLLKGGRFGYAGPDYALRRRIQSARKIEMNGEPAQITHCPCCNSITAIPTQGLESGRHNLNLLFRGDPRLDCMIPDFQINDGFPLINNFRIDPIDQQGFFTLTLDFTLTIGQVLTLQDIENWWYNLISPLLGDVQLLSSSPTRPGYFLLNYYNVQNQEHACNFDIYCPNPICELNGNGWAELVPLSREDTSTPEERGITPALQPIDDDTLSIVLPHFDNYEWQLIPNGFRQMEYIDGKFISSRIPIPAFTVDSQIYHRCPTIIIGTVDKFAQLPVEPKIANIFGNVTHYHSRWGYYRSGVLPSYDGQLSSRFRSDPPVRSSSDTLRTSVQPFHPPELVLQDELHLIEGPLGGLVGIYETVVDTLSQRTFSGVSIGPKYIASTATVRQAHTQVQALYNRELYQFPPSAINSDDRFFSIESETHPLELTGSGRIYVGICAPGKGAQTPIVRIWSSILQEAFIQWTRLQNSEADNFFTLVGYFNAVRELAGAESLYRQDIIQRLLFRAGTNARELENYIELSGRTDSLTLPKILEDLNVSAPNSTPAVFTTSMFGTGVDVNRLGLMVVHGQPKSTASYIQATGRVGRSDAGLVITFLRSSRPRDLDHYEFFEGYHRALYKHVEPVTVTPFASRARERALGPIGVALLRQAREIEGITVNDEWPIQQRLIGRLYHCYANRMATHRNDPEVRIIEELVERRAMNQPPGRIPRPLETQSECSLGFNRWENRSRMIENMDHFIYKEYATLRPPEREVVLGDPHHRSLGLFQVYQNVPQSLRDVEEATTLKS